MPRVVEILHDVRARGLGADEWFALDGDDFCWPEHYHERVVELSEAACITDDAVLHRISKILCGGGAERKPDGEVAWSCT